MLSTAGRVLAEKMNVLQLTFYTAPVSCAMLFPVYLVREVLAASPALPAHPCCPK